MMDIIKITTLFGLTLAVALVSVVLGLVYKAIDRKLHAKMQRRIGPPLRQPFRDVVKLLMKETIVPENAIDWLFNLAPAICLASSIMLLLYTPIFTTAFAAYGDMVLLVYLLLLPSLAMAIGGFASGSPYAAVGAQREVVMMMSYELPVAAVIATIATALGSFAFPAVPIWGVVGPVGTAGFALLFLVLLVVIPAELSKIPYDAPEAETEIAGGLLAEYSGRNLALFYLADGVKMLALAAIAVVLFLPYQLTSFVSIPAMYVMYASYANALFTLVKLFAVMFISVILARTAFARLKINQVAGTYLIYVGLISLLGMALVLIDKWVML